MFSLSSTNTILSKEMMKRLSLMKIWLKSLRAKIILSFKLWKKYFKFLFLLPL